MTDRITAFLRVALVTAGILCIVTTALPFVRTDVGWVRVWDFPRFQSAVICFAILIALAAMKIWRQKWGIVMLAGLCIALTYQTARILPYTPVVDIETKLAGDSQTNDCVSVLSANVHQQNRRKDVLLALIAQYNPDILLLLETDAWWRDALTPVLDRYRQNRSEIQSNRYGLMFISQLKGTAAIRHLVESGIPSVMAKLELPSGRRIVFYGLHPEPPRIGQSTDERDAELITVAREIRERAIPTIVAGDLNDVAWSRTTRRFKKISNMLDPRIGRGFYSTFHAEYRLLRWPIDHIFISENFRLTDLKVLPHIGSDHFPIFGRFCLAAGQ